MTESQVAPGHSTSRHCSQQAAVRRRRRLRAERNFRRLGLAAIAVGLSFVVVLFVSVSTAGYTAFQQTFVQLNIDWTAEHLGIDRVTEQSLIEANFSAPIQAALRAEFPSVRDRQSRRKLTGMVSSGAQFQLRAQLAEQPQLLGTTQSVWLPADDDVDMFMKGNIDREQPEADRRLSDLQISWIDQWQRSGRVKLRFNSTLFASGDSREPEQSGLWGALVGSFYTLAITLLLSFPLGVATAVYLEEFAPKRSRWMDLIEVNINNLAAVPSIVFGLLGLAVFINFFGLPRSTPLVAGLVLALMTLPTVIIASRAALKSIPPSIRQAALAVGASKTQTVLHHVVVLALPGMLTGTIIGMAQALGETAPLLMIGMVAFLVDVPSGFTQPATVLPVQIFLWSDSPERAFAERTSAAIMVLLGFLVLMNLLAVILRRRFEQRW